MGMAGSSSSSNHTTVDSPAPSQSRSRGSSSDHKETSGKDGWVGTWAELLQEGVCGHFQGC